MTWTIPQRAEAQDQLRERLYSLCQELERIIEAFPDPSPDGLERLYTEIDLYGAESAANYIDLGIRNVTSLLGLQPTEQP